MSDLDLSATPAAAERTLEPVRPPRWTQRRLAPVALIVVVLGVAAGMLAATSGSSSVGRPPAGSSLQTSHPRRHETAAQRRYVAIRRLVLLRSRAILTHDRAEFMATVDPRAGRFRRREAAMFGDLAQVPLASWRYSVSRGDARGLAAVQRRYRAPVWASAHFAVSYRLAGFDKRAASAPQYPTFVERSGQWYLRSLSDFRRPGRGPISSTDLWDFGPVAVVRRPAVLVLGPPSELSTMNQVADLAQSAIPQVTAVWGPRWAKKVVIVVPATQHQASLLTGDQQLGQIVAITSSEQRDRSGRQPVVGDRVTINPSNWSNVNSLGARIVITHELTHVASKAYTGNETPKWLAEGFADYVGFRNSGLSAGVVASELQHLIRAGHSPSQLPGNHDFAGSNPKLSAAYEEAWLACTYIADHYGQHRLVQFYRAVGRSVTPSKQAVDHGLQVVLHLDRREFRSRWQAFMRSELG